MEPNTSEINLFTASLVDIKHEDIVDFCNQKLMEDIDLDYKGEWPDHLDHLICAMANTQGGLIIIGAEEIEKTRKPKIPLKGVEGSEDVLRSKVNNISFDSIYPPVIPEVKICPIPESQNRSIVVIRVSPSRLMHAVDRRKRIYIRVSDSNRGYELASINDLEWLWEQREKSEKFRSQILNNAAQRSESSSIDWGSDDAKNRWFTDPRLVVSVAPSFPGLLPIMELKNLLDIAREIGVIKSSWKSVLRELPWRDDIWRGIPGGIAIINRGDKNKQQYLELGQWGSFYFVNTIVSNSISAQFEPSSIYPKFIRAFVPLAYLDLALIYITHLYKKISFRQPITIDARIEKIKDIHLHYNFTRDLPDDTVISRGCTDNEIVLVDKEIYPMTAEENKALIARFVEELFNRGNTGIVGEIVAPDFIEREQLPPGIPSGSEGVKVLTTIMRNAFPDFKATIEDILAEGDKVVMRMTWSGTQKGEFMGVPATGKRVSFVVIDIIRIANGKVVEHWGQMDSMSLMQQLGAIPGPVEG